MANDTLTPKANESQPVTNVDLNQREILTIFFSLISCIILVSLDTSVVGTSGPSIVRDLGNYSLFPWIASGYLLSSAAVVPVYGKLSDIVGRHAVLQFAIFCFALGSLLGALSQSMIMLIISRAIQGMGGSGIIVMSQTTIGDILAPSERGKYQGVISSSTAISSIAGPLIGGAFTTYWTWRGVFWINLPFCVIASFTIFSNLRKITIKARRVTSIRDIDWLGSLTIICATVSLIMPLVWAGSTYSWSSGQIIGLLVTSGVLFGCFFLAESWWGVRANIPLHMFRVRNFTLSALIRFFGGAVLYGVITYLPSYWQTIHNETAVISGIRTAPLMFFAVIGSIIAGQSIARIHRYGWKPVPVIGTAFQVLGIGLISMTGVNTSYVKLVFFMIFIGLGYGLTGPSASIVVQSSVPLADLAAASAAGTFMQSLGGSIGVTVVGVIFNNVYASRINYLFEVNNLGIPPSDAIDLNGSEIAALPVAQQNAFYEAYAYGFDRSMYAVLAFALMQLVLTWALENVQLRGREKHEPPVKEMELPAVPGDVNLPQPKIAEEEKSNNDNRVQIIKELEE